MYLEEKQEFIRKYLNEEVFLALYSSNNKLIMMFCPKMCKWVLIDDEFVNLETETHKEAVRIRLDAISDITVVEYAKCDD